MNRRKVENHLNEGNGEMLQPLMVLSAGKNGGEMMKLARVSVDIAKRLRYISF